MVGESYDVEHRGISRAFYAVTIVFSVLYIRKGRILAFLCRKDGPFLLENPNDPRKILEKLWRNHTYGIRKVLGSCS